jgi:hypothetical protein
LIRRSRTSVSMPELQVEWAATRTEAAAVFEPFRLDVANEVPFPPRVIIHGRPHRLDGYIAFAYLNYRNTVIRLKGVEIYNEPTMLVGCGITFRCATNCLNRYFTGPASARALIEAWRRDYNERRPKKYG